MPRHRFSFISDAILIKPDEETLCKPKIERQSNKYTDVNLYNRQETLGSIWHSKMSFLN